MNGQITGPIYRRVAGQLSLSPFLYCSLDNLVENLRRHGALHRLGNRLPHQTQTGRRHVEH